MLYCCCYFTCRIRISAFASKQRDAASHLERAHKSQKFVKGNVKIRFLAVIAIISLDHGAS